MSRTRNLMLVTFGLLVITLPLFGCGKRVYVATGTTLGFNATPGDLQTRPPQVTLAYKRAETALIPTAGKPSVRDEKNSAGDTDAYSTLAVFNFETEWFGKTEVESFIATGHASRMILGENGEETEFTRAFAKATVGVVSQDLQDRKKALSVKIEKLTEEQVRKVLKAAGCASDPNSAAQDALQDCIRRAKEDTVKKLEEAF